MKLKLIAALAVATGLFAAPALAAKPGCGLGTHVGLAEGKADVGPLHLGVDGQLVGASIFCNYAAGVFMGGVYVEASKAFGDLDTLLGIDYTAAIGARVGPRLGNAWLYAAAEHAWIATSGDTLKAIGLGIGIDVNIPDTNWSADLRAMEYFVEEVAGPTIDVGGRVVRLGFNYHFNRDPILGNGRAPLK
jgi:hypothetical protein